MNIEESDVELLDFPVPSPRTKRKRDEGDDEVHKAAYRPVPKHPLLDSITNRIQQNMDDREEKDAMLQSKRETEKVHSQYLKQNITDHAELARAGYAAGHWAKRNGIKESNLRRTSNVKRKRTARTSTPLNSSSSRLETIPTKRWTANSDTSPDYPSRLLNRNSLVSCSRNTDSEYTEPDNGEDDILPIILSNYNCKHVCPVLFCEAELTSEGALGQHMNLFQHSPCNPCRYAQDMKLKPDPSCYMCPDCDQEFSTRDICSEHMKQENHLVFYTPLGIMAYLCPQCLHLFQNLEICWRHMEQSNHHQISYPFTDDRESDFSLPIPAAEEFVRDYIGKCKLVPFQLQCLDCDMIIACPASLRDHFNETNNQHNVSTFTNKDLNDIFSTYIRTYSCDSCHRLFTEQSEPNAKHSCANGIVGTIKVDQVHTYAEFIKRCALTLINSLESANQYGLGRHHHEPKQHNTSDSVGEEVGSKKYRLLNNVDDIKAALESEHAVTIQEIKCNRSSQNVKSKSNGKETSKAKETGTNRKMTKSSTSQLINTSTKNGDNREEKGTSVKCSNMNEADSSADKTKKLTKRHTNESIPENTCKSLMPGFERVQNASQEIKSYPEPGPSEQVNNLDPSVEEIEYLEISDSEEEIIIISESEDEEEQSGTGDENKGAENDEGDEGENYSVDEENNNRNILGKKEIDEKENDRNCVKSPVCNGISKNELQELKRKRKSAQAKYDRLSTKLKRKKYCGELTPELNTELLDIEFSAGKQKTLVLQLEQQLIEHLTVITGTHTPGNNQLQKLKTKLKSAQSKYNKLNGILKGKQYCAEQTPSELLDMKLSAGKQKRLISQIEQKLRDHNTVIRGTFSKFRRNTSVSALQLQNQDDNLVSTEHLKNMKNIVFLDLDNCMNFFLILPHCPPNSMFVWGFYGGGNVVSRRVLTSVFDEMQHRGLVYVDKPCGKTKDAADFALVLTVGKMDERLPPHIAFTIISADKGFHEVVRQMEQSARKTQIVNPHEDQLHLMSILTNIVEM